MVPTVGGWQVYPAFFALSVIVGVTVPLALACREGSLSPRLVGSVLLVVAATLLGAKGFGLAERDWTVGTFWGEVIGGYRAPGAIAGAAFGLCLLPSLGVSPWRTADLLAPGAAFGMAVFRTGCFLAGCCAGVRCELPWGVRFPADSVVWNRDLSAGLITSDAAWSLPVHPLQVYFGIWSLGLAVLTLWLRKSGRREGQVFLAYLALASAGKWVLEGLRYGYLAHLQYAALATTVLAAAIYWWRESRSLSRLRLGTG